MPCMTFASGSEPIPMSKLNVAESSEARFRINRPRTVLPFISDWLVQVSPSTELWE